MKTFQHILAKVAEYKPDFNKDLLVKAFSYASKNYAGLYRLSGDPYIDHVLEVTHIFLTLKPGENAIVACLFHAIEQSSTYNLDEIRSLFGQDIANLVEALESMNKIKSIKYGNEAESIRKMFLVMAKDLRVVLIKFADRLHNMQTLDFHNLTSRKRIARETLDIYVPIAARLGVYNLKSKLEDLCFKYLYTRQYEDLSLQLHEYLLKRGKNINQIKNELEKFLTANGIIAEIDGRIKNLYSIYKKLKLKSHSGLDDIFDVFAMRIILPTKYDSLGNEINDDLYSVLALIHSNWKSLPHRFKDYAAHPKSNGYQSIHTAVIGLSSKSSDKPTEIQIRSRRMHEEAEYGFSSHWLYEKNKKNLKSNTDKDIGFVNETEVGWIDLLSKMKNDTAHRLDKVDDLKLNVFNDRIFTFTPNGEVKDLPYGSTPIDFAYAIHSNVGNHCHAAKVNGMIVPLSYQLKNGEVVEIIVNNNAKPTSNWLSIAKTSGARSKIRNYLRSLNIGDQDLAVAATKSLLVEPNPLRLKGASALQKSPSVLEDKKDEVYLSGEKGLPFRLANCCKPNALHSIVGFVTRGNAVSIHRHDCRILANSANLERVVEASWKKDSTAKNHPVKINVEDLKRARGTLVS